MSRSSGCTVAARTHAARTWLRRARELQPHVEKFVGAPILLKLKRANGETFSVKLVAVARPEAR